MASDLRQLYPPPRDDLSHSNLSEEAATLVDIVAIHGLNETAAEAWTDTRSRTNWLSDLLPHDIRIARVLAFDYDATASSFFGEQCVDRIQHLAHTLVAHLQADRSLAGCERRPLIFICHGLGGILVKKALAYASTKTAQQVVHYYSIFLSTYAALFFGTPHHAVDKDRWLDLERQQRVRTGNTFLSRHRSVSRDGRRIDTMQVITDQFNPIMKDFRIYYFWEQLPTDLGHSFCNIVEQASAAPSSDDRERSGINATHMNMVKFATRNANYKTVIGALTRYVREAPKKIERRWKIAATELRRLRLNEANELLGFPPHLDDSQSPEQRTAATQPPPKTNRFFYPPSESTLDFVGREADLMGLGNAMFEECLTNTDRQKRYVVHGLGGAGKTQFCSQFARDHRERFWAVFTIHAATMETVKESFSKIGKLGGLEATESAGKYWLSQLEEPWLLIIDNADDPLLDLISILPEGSYGHVLITTRNPDLRRFGTNGNLRLEGLGGAEALRLLLKRADIPSPWDAATETAGNQIARTLGYLALAIVQAGTSIFRKICDIKDYLEFYHQHRNRYKKLPRSHDRPSEEDDVVYSAFELSLSHLRIRDSSASQDALEILNIVAFFHFEHISIEIFIRASNNRLASLAIQQNGSFVERLVHPVLSRLQAPAALPRFLKADADLADKFRIRKALYELFSLSLISYDGRSETFSLHPLVHAWARDRLGIGGRALWAQVALNVISEAILLPPADVGDGHGQFRTELLRHLDACLLACPPTFPHLSSRFGKLQLSTALFLQPTLFFLIKDKVVTTAKCGYVYAERGRFDQAASYLSIIKDVLVATLGVRHEKTMKAMLGLAGTLWGLGRLDEAIELQKSVVIARTKVFGFQHIDTLLAQDQLGKSFWLNGQYGEALALQQPTVNNMEAVLGADDNRTLEAMDNLGVTLGAWQRYDESYQIHKSVWDARKRKQEKNRLLLLTTASNTAMALFDLDKLDESSEIMQMVYDERKQKLGKEHPWTLWALCYLAKIQVKRGQYDLAEKMLVEGIAAGKRSLSETHLGVLMGCGELARIYFHQERFEEAEHLCIQTLSQLEISRGPEHPDSVYARWKLALLYKRQKKFVQAIDECQTALEHAQARLTNRHPLYQKIEADLEDLVQSQQGISRARSIHTANSKVVLSSVVNTELVERSIPSLLQRRNLKPRQQMTW